MEEVLTGTVADGTAAAGAADFEAVVRQHQGRLFRVLVAIVGDADEAATLVQETFLKAHRNWAGFRGEASLGTWLVRIAVNLGRDHLRSRKIQFWKRLVRGDEQPVRPAAAASPEQSLMARQALEAVWRAVDKLSAQQRVVFTLRFVEEMSLAEIAQATGLDESTVKTHLFRAVHTVREKVKEKL